MSPTRFNQFFLSSIIFSATLFLQLGHIGFFLIFVFLLQQHFEGTATHD